jgi:hypothetical protein
MGPQRNVDIERRVVYLGVEPWEIQRHCLHEWLFYAY